MAKKGTGRSDRWRAAVAAALEVAGKMEALAGELESAMSDLRDVQTEFQEWRDNLPENLQSSATGEKLEAVAELDLEWGTDDSVQDALDKLNEAEGTDLPLGFGRD